MLTQDQLNREAHHRLSQARAAFHWRARAEKARKAALIMTTETETLMMATIAEDYEFLARLEERLSGRFL